MATARAAPSRGFPTGAPPAFPWSKAHDVPQLLQRALHAPSAGPPGDGAVGHSPDAGQQLRHDGDVPPRRRSSMLRGHHEPTNGWSGEHYPDRQPEHVLGLRLASIEHVARFAHSYRAPGPRSTRPGFAPVCRPSRTTNVPFTYTIF